MLNLHWLCLVSGLVFNLQSNTKLLLTLRNLQTAPSIFYLLFHQEEEKKSWTINVFVWKVVRLLWQGTVI